ncbi:microsomal signal peptidase 12 kDa subunit-like protein [Dinothrombium tinctorium]|uniref:Signal peptidase complex subunit 1 n=1 Tax=Dinothrombium tinctorium TaxID=1965070 RepID=A0A443QXY0_9ACAR|nr:microsomal signal peptidase 12 kDa subunit-like protein [Dinothrombium tinctorium]
MDFLKKLPSHLDFEGQRLAERIFQTVITAFAVVGLVAGYAVERFSITVYTLGVGFAIAALLTLPPWPMYRRHPLKWQKADDGSAHSAKSKKKK